MNGRNTINWDKRLEFDIEYIENISFTFDIKIVLKTILKVLKKEDIVLVTDSIMKNLDDERKK